MRAWLAAHGVPVVLDVGPCSRRHELQTQGSPFFEGMEDSQALHYGEAVRFHPMMFAFGTGGPPEPGQERKVHIAPDRTWHVWSEEGFWIEVPIASKPLYSVVEYFAMPIGVNGTMSKIGLTYGGSSRMLKAVRILSDKHRYPIMLPSGPTPVASELAGKMFPAF